MRVLRGLAFFPRAPHEGAQASSLHVGPSGYQSRRAETTLFSTHTKRIL